MEYKALGSDRDPVGSVFLAKDTIHRGVRLEYVADSLAILSHPVVQGMLDNKIVSTYKVEPGLQDYPLTLEQRRIDPQSYCYEWPMIMLQDAAILTLEICQQLNEAGFVLKDGTPSNILFEGPIPLLVDFGSIMPQEDDILWVAYDQFFRQFAFPLLIGHTMSGRVARAMLLGSEIGISPEEMTHLLPAFTWMKKPWLVNRLYLPMLAINLARQSGQDKKIKEYRRAIPLRAPERGAFFRALSLDIQSMNFNSGKSFWSKYYEDINAFFDPGSFHAKQRLIADLLERCKPATVVDIGCNQGGYSILAAKSGAKVTAFDTDEDSVTGLYRLAKQNGLKILPVVGDVLYPSPQAGWRGIEFPAAPIRFRSQMALALALVHHLAITQIQTFERIVQTLGDYAERWLITEFVPLEDVRSQEILLTNRRDMSWYCLEAFVASLKKEFAVVETYPSYPAGRTICFCQR